MREQYTLIYILPFCVEMIVLQMRDSKYEIYDRLIKTISLDQEDDENHLSKKCIFKILNVIYGYRNVIRENRIDENIKVITDGLDAFENIDHLYGGIDKIFNNANETVKDANKSYLVFLFFMDILEKAKNHETEVIKLHEDNLSFYKFDEKKLNDYHEVELYDSRIDDIFKKKEYDISSIINGIKNIFKMKNIKIKSKAKNNVFTLNMEEYKFMSRIIKKKIIDKNEIDRVIKKIGHMKNYEIKNDYNMTDKEVYKMLKIITILEMLTRDHSHKIILEEFNLTSYFTKVFVLNKQEKVNGYYRFLYRKLVKSKMIDVKSFELINDSIKEVLGNNKISKRENTRRCILIKTALNCIFSNVEISHLRRLGYGEEDIGVIEKWINNLKIENLLTKRDYTEIKDNLRQVDGILALLYMIVVIRKNHIPVKIIKDSNHVQIIVESKKISLFEKEIYNSLKEKIHNLREEGMKVVIRLEG